ncbi:hypothetical protein [Nostoc sp. ChiQUE01b]|uniref:hypothetical protein n=1 Tax=Nostoc sp. ChiQUE01b TaxID=3075376 RepID=UPI002AD54246|nr:hypothetical protein [Nostoc sp. ChiQUE01b]MDZ8258996.1 hypothetical protein [Nostoc sp. ChiQUE01b]
MTIAIGRWQFEGPYSHTSNLDNRSGVYAILDGRVDGMYWMIDIGESTTVRARIENHDRANCWVRNQQGTLAVAVLYTPHFQQAGRRTIEQEIRSMYPLACGIR